MQPLPAVEEEVEEEAEEEEEVEEASPLPMLIASSRLLPWKRLLTGTTGLPLASEGSETVVTAPAVGGGGRGVKRWIGGSTQRVKKCEDGWGSALVALFLKCNGCTPLALAHLGACQRSQSA